MGRVVESVGLVIASVGRPGELAATLRSLLRMPFLPAEVQLVGASAGDLPGEDFGGTGVHVGRHLSPVKSSAVQRNVGVRAFSPGIRYVAILDDDVEVHRDYFAEIARCFDQHPELVAFSGNVLRNGGIGRVEARALLDGTDIPAGMPAYGKLPRDWPGLYGCAMNFRRAPLERELFDENLPLYALGEDTEIGFRMARHGMVGGSARCRMVHLAHKAGRGSELTVGYSQIANFWYFTRKGVGYPTGLFVRQNPIGLPFRNFIGIFRREPDHAHRLDRKGRFLGNCLAIADLLRGRLHPRRIHTIGKRR